MLCFLAVLLVIVDLCSVFVPVLAVSDRGVLAEDGNNDDKMVLDLSDPGDSSVVSDAEGEDVFQEGSVSSEGDSYSVTVSYQADAEIPDGAWLEEKEILPGDPLYDELYEKLVAAHGNQTPVFARFFDISIMDGEEKIQPAAPVNVEICLEDIPEKDETRALQIDHFNDENGEVEPLECTNKSEEGVQNIKFDAESFSIYSVYQFESYGTTEDFDGKSFLIVNHIDGERIGYALTATPNANGNRLLYSVVWFKNDERVIASTEPDEPALWTFTRVTENDVTSGAIAETVFTDSRNRDENGSILYFLSTKVDDSVRYLTINKQSLYLSPSPMPFLIVTDAAYPKMVMIRCAYGTGNEKYKLNYKDTDKGFKGSDYAVNQNDYQYLLDAKRLDIEPQDEKHFADKISVSEMEDGSTVVIYRSVWNELFKEYNLVAIDGYGDLIDMSDEGSSVGWYSLSNSQGKDLAAIEWKYTVGRNSDGDETGYYWLQNTVTGAYIAPRAIYGYDGAKLYDVILPGDDIVAGDSQSFNYSLQMPGRQNGEFESTLIAWSKDDGTEGLYLKDDGERLQLVKGGIGDADTFNFAAVAQIEELSTVPTLDSRSLGLKINMFNYPSRKWMSNEIGSDAVQLITQGAESSRYYVPELVDCRLNEDGIPVSLVGERHALTALFDPDSDYFVTEANHLLLESSYSETGYFEYNSAKNYAYLNTDTGDFTVYDQLGSPTKVNTHGHFMPFSRILTDVYTDQTNINDEYMNPLPADEPRKGQALHKIETAPKLDGGYDYNYGMSVETNFIQPTNGKDRNGNEIIFEFSGDDDLWIFVDDVLILDLGGIHSAHRGTINFTTGEISTHNAIPVSYSGTVRKDYEYPATIREAFRKAGVFPDGSSWDDEKAEEFFDGETLRGDSFGHKMRMFYLERGKGSANLRTRFNISTTPDDLLIAKEISGTDKQQYTDKDFLFQAFLIIDGVEVPLTDDYASVAEMTDGGGWRDTDEPTTFENITIEGQEYENVIRLGHDEGVVFKDARLQNYPYYVREIAVDPLFVSEVRGNDVLLESRINEGDEALRDYSVEPALVKQRKQLIYNNVIRPQELHITKKLDLSLGQTPDDSLVFQFQVLLGPSADKLSAYSVAPYYIMKEGVYYYRIDSRMVPLTQGEDGRYYYSSGDTMQVIPSKDPADPIFDWSSQTGYIDYVPADYTVVIKQVIPDMVFQVTETSMPQGCSLEKISDSGSTFKTLTDEDSEVLQGQILKDQTADVIVLNQYSEGAFRLVKVAAEHNNWFLDGAMFELYGGDPEYANDQWNFYIRDLITTLSSGDDGFLRADDEYYGADKGSADLKLSSGTYYLKETKAPDNYEQFEGILAFSISDSGILSMLGTVDWDKDEKKLIFTELEDFRLTESTVIEGIELQTGLIADTYSSETVNVSGSKAWDDDGDRDDIRPDSITVDLFADGEKIDSVTVTEKDGWKWTFEKLPKYDDGDEIEYTMSEQPVSGYKADKDSIKDGEVITNKHEPEKVSVSGSKAWDDDGDRDGIRPDSITVDLYANGEKIDSVTVTEKDGWKWTFEKLFKYDDGDEIEYTMSEQPVSGYKADKDSIKDGEVITNKHEPEKVSVSGSKVWDDSDDQDGIRPGSITVDLYANGEKIDSVTVTEKDGWKWTFEKLPKYDDGEEIKYTMSEQPVSGYESDRIIYKDGDVITNKHEITDEAAPITDDASSMGVWAIVSCVSLLALAVLMIMKKKNDRK